ncbi:hypothetical protein ILUMI_16807, partial [Ignelater luminosus]
MMKTWCVDTEKEWTRKWEGWRSNQKNHRKCCRGSNWKTRTPEEEGMRSRMQKARREEYEDLRGVAKNICKKKKGQQVENQIVKIQKLHARKTKGFYKVVRATSIDVDGTILNKDKQIVGYVDDLDLARSEKALKEEYGKLNQKSTKIGLEII